MSRQYHEKARIIRRELETPDIVSLEFDCSMDAETGQFVMAWIPDVGERPISLCWDNPVEIAVKRVGKVTEKMFDMKVGDELFIRGPYGRPFLFPERKEQSYLIGGGCGIAPISFLSLKLADKDIQHYSFFGARTKEDLFYGGIHFNNILVSTEDGSAGYIGLVTDLFDIQKPRNDSYFYICGPEAMMIAAAERAIEYTGAENIYLLTERYMKCGRGICGSCELDGYRTCVDGPVFSYDQLIGGDFGCRKREKSGKLVEL